MRTRAWLLIWWGVLALGACAGGQSGSEGQPDLPASPDFAGGGGGAGTHAGAGASAGARGGDAGAGGEAGNAEVAGSDGAGSCQRLQKLTNLSPTSLPLGDVYSGVISDGRDVYFSGINTLYRVAVSGGPAETVYSGPVGAFAAGGGVVAWVPLALDSGNPAGLTIETTDGIHAIELPDRVLPSAWSTLLVDTDGNVFFEVDLPTADRSHTWRWDPATGSAAEMPGVGMPDTGGSTNLYWADRGQVIWANNVGLYLTDISTGTPRLLVDNSVVGFGGLVGLDATNVYGEGDTCPKSACPFTISGVARAGGAPFVAFESVDDYWTVRLEADDSGLYWMDWQSNRIFHAALSPSGPPKPVVDPGSGIADFATDACNLYWLAVDATQTTRLMAIAK